ncbi:aldehyde dehydrogenase family protein [Leisingera aquaemixtae]|uniref:aldehyde dehydrogenase family protein n=1 Tax=Leisingera aquaemixtae TaxID=1396826 RepID=UPI0021A62BB5|nr:aldehyde dehydrogenase family protein [Leisingera aquaemixtae]
MALRAIVFSAVGTVGQRCTSLRRLIVHEDIYDALIPRLIKAYEGLPIGDPLADGTLVGPLIDAAALDAMSSALERANPRAAPCMAAPARWRTATQTPPMSTGDCRDACPDRHHAHRNLRPDPLCGEVFQSGPSH